MPYKLPPRVVVFSRTLHIYLTMFALLGLIFFSATGFILNHPGWFELTEPMVRHAEFQLPAELLKTPTDKLAVVEYLRAQQQATGAVDSFEDHDNELRVAFKSPGHSVDAVIERPGGKGEMTFEATGVVGILEDLHKGEHSGGAWKLVIDLVSVSLFVASLTGLILLIAVPKRRKLGLLTAAIGLALGAGVYFLLVP